MHTPNHIYEDLAVPRPKLLSDQKDKGSFRTRAVSPVEDPYRLDAAGAESRERNTKKIAEALNAKITQLKAKYTQLASSIHGSPHKKHGDCKENVLEQPPSARPEATKKLTIKLGADAGKRLRRHNSQENIMSIPAKTHRQDQPIKGILRQSSKPNVQNEETVGTAEGTAKPQPILKLGSKAHPCVESEAKLCINPLTVRASGTLSRRDLPGKQSLGSVAMRKLLDQAKQGVMSAGKEPAEAVPHLDDKENDVIRNINELLKHLEEIKSPRSQKRNELNTLAKDIIIKTELKSPGADPVGKKESQQQRNVPLSGHSSMPRTNVHKRARSDCEVIKAKCVLPKASGDKDELLIDQEGSPVKMGMSARRNSSNRLTSRRPSGAIVPVIECEKKEKAERSGEGSTKATNSAPPGQPGAEDPNSSSFIRLQDALLQDRERLIRYNTQYYAKHHELPPTSVDYYKFIKLIGKGAFGKVTLGVHKLTGKYVAIKTIEKSYMKDDFSRKKVFREVYILKKIRHANVIRLLEVFESSKHLLIVMEYAGGGDLLQYVKRHKRLSESEAKTLFRQVVYGMGHIHSHSVLHRDIKLDNILLDADNGVKICDFGVSKILDKNVSIKEQCGTPAYIAPEIISDQGYKGFTADHWSLGVLLYAMLSGTVPFKASNMKDLHRLIRQGQFTYSADISKDAKSLIEGLIRLKPEERMTVPEILAHPWLKDDDLDSDVYMGKEECVNPMQESKSQPDINCINVENLFFKSKSKTKLSYADYCYIANDFYTQHIDEEALRTLEKFGYPRSVVIDSLHKGDLNHAVASYNLLVLP